MTYIALDVGTTQTAFAVMSDQYDLLDFGKVDNEELLDSTYYSCDVLIYEEFASYGMPIGKTTMESIKWNGRFIQRALDGAKSIGKEIKVVPMLRKDVKMNLCGTMKAKDSNIRQALIDRFGNVGTKKDKGFFYGVSKDVWSAVAICTTYIDSIKTE